MKLIKKALLLSKFFLMISLLSQEVYAERVANLYTLSSLVADTSDEQRAAVSNVLLLDLLVRVSGTQRVLEKMPPKDFTENSAAYSDHPDFELWTELTSAQRLINQYSYTASSQLLTAASGEQVNAQQLELTFDEAGVKQLLRRLQAPVWDANRPKVLFLVALEGRGGRTLITPEANFPLSNVLVAQSEKRGVPYLLPDFTVHPMPDTLFSDIWGGFSQSIIAAADPYQPDAIAVGKVRVAGNQWRAEWRLFTGMNSVKRTVSVATLRDAFQEGVNFTAEELSSRYASQASQGVGVYKVLVSNVSQVQDYAAINNYLNNLSLTSKVRVVYSAEQRILFEVTLRGGLDQLRVNLTLDSRLKEESLFELEQNQEITKQADAYFRWQAN